MRTPPRHWPALFPLVVFLLLATKPVGKAEEMRAAWVASVFNLNFPSHSGMSADAQRQEIHRLVNLAADRGLNALMVQVRPEGDALYESRLEPWSRYLTGAQGGSPGYDPLAEFIAEGHRRGVAIHAWINPFRAGSGGGSRVASHVSRQMAGSARKVGSLTWMDPGDPAVREEVIRVVRDIVSRYAVAGVILDDYFYPYPGSGIPRGTFPDEATYARYRTGGGTMSVAEWRRSNIDNLIRDLQRAVSSARSGTRFGVSPFGIYQPNVPPGVQARVDQFNELYADPVRWLREGWVDYLSPQLYWPDAGPQSFSALLSWWRSPAVNPRGVPIYPSISIDRLGGSENWPASEIAKQLRLEQNINPRTGSGGFILWSIKPLEQDRKGVGAIVAASAAGH